MMNFPGLIVSDSGGFQIMSLIHQQKTKGKITKQGIKFSWRARGRDQQILFTPEMSIKNQFAINSDIMVVLDYFTDPKASKKDQEYSTELTLDWANRSKDEFNRQIKQRQLSEANRPWLMGVVQGGNDLKLRQKMANKLVSMDFDLYGYGGWPMDEQGKFDNELFKFNATLTPDDKPRFALGVGKPKDIIAGVKYGYHFFDCVLPTRDARHCRLYTAKDKFMYISRGIYAKDPAPIEAGCSCHTCRNYSRGYLHHLFKINDALAWRLATIHNLSYYQGLIKTLRNYKFNTLATLVFILKTKNLLYSWTHLILSWLVLPYLKLRPILLLFRISTKITTTLLV